MSKSKKQTIVEPKELTLEEKIAKKRDYLLSAKEELINHENYLKERIIDNALSVINSFQRELTHKANEINRLKTDTATFDVNTTNELLRSLLWTVANDFSRLSSGIRWSDEINFIRGQQQMLTKFEEIQNLEKELELENKENGNFIKL